MLQAETPMDSIEIPSTASTGASFLHVVLSAGLDVGNRRRVHLFATDEGAHDTKSAVEHHEIGHGAFGNDPETSQAELARRSRRAHGRGLDDGTAEAG